MLLGTAWIRLGYGTLSRRHVQDSCNLCCKCKYSHDVWLLINSLRKKITFVFQTDLKGLPIFIMNHVLKRHPLALHYVRRQLTDPYAVSRNFSSNHDSADELEVTVGMTALKHDRNSKDGSRTFEEGVSARHFIDHSQ